MSEASNQAADERRRGSARRDRPVARRADTTAGERMGESNRARGPPGLRGSIAASAQTGGAKQACAPGSREEDVGAERDLQAAER